jgi:transcriptional regulator GlxA family with amidase domain
MAQAIRFCEENFARDLSVPLLASRMFLSTGHFSERFAREAGMPPGAYIRRLRLERARSLLREGEMSVTQAAREAGWGDAAHFSRAFRSAYGMAPSEYKREARKK